MAGGDSSEVYIGATTDDAPIPKPTMMRRITKGHRLGANAVRIAPTAKMIAMMMSVFLRPSQSAILPPTAAPRMAPMRTALTAISCVVDVRWNCVLRKPCAPEITPVSYPKSRPPRAAMKPTR